MAKQTGWKTAIAGCAVAILAASCGKADGGGAAGAKEEGETTAAVDYTKGEYEVVIQDLAGSSEEPFENTYGQYIRKKLPNFKITFLQSGKGTTLQDLTVTGQNLDIIYGSLEVLPGPLLNSGQQYDMTGLIREHGIDLSKFEQTTIDAVKEMDGGKIYFLPVLTMVQVLFYNKDIFDKLGVAYPKDGMTWDDLHALNQKLTRSESGVNYMGYSASPNHILRMNQMSVPFSDPKTNKPMLTDERWKSAIETYFLNEATANYKAWSIAKKGLPYYTEMTKTQELAMMAFNSQFPFDGPQYVQGLNWDLVSLPTLKDQPNVGSQSSPRMFAITQTAKNKGPAMEVIKLLTSLEVQKEYSKRGFMTVLNDDSVKELIGSESAFKDKNWKAVYYNKIAPKSYQSIYDGDILQTILRPAVLKAVTGQADLNTALREAQEQAEKYIQTSQQK